MQQCLAGQMRIDGRLRPRRAEVTPQRFPINELEWVESLAAMLRKTKLCRSAGLLVRTKERIPYGYEVLSYGDAEDDAQAISLETDLALLEEEDGRWKPRLIVEGKIRRISRKSYPLPGRLYRHGAHFDFMISFASTKPTRTEKARLVVLLEAEVEASRTLEKILYESRRRDRDRFTLLHRRLHLE